MHLNKVFFIGSSVILHSNIFKHCKKLTDIYFTSWPHFVMNYNGSDLTNCKTKGFSRANLVNINYCDFGLIESGLYAWSSNFPQPVCIRFYNQNLPQKINNNWDILFNQTFGYDFINRSQAQYLNFHFPPRLDTHPKNLAYTVLMNIINSVNEKNNFKINILFDYII